MKRFVIRQNIEHYRALLGVTTDPSQRRSIEQLLHDEEAKLKKYDEDNKKESSPARRLNQSRFNSPGSLAKFAAMRRASSLSAAWPPLGDPVRPRGRNSRAPDRSFCAR